MNVVIHKHNLAFGENKLRLVEGAELLCVQEQFGSPILYTKHDPDKLISDRDRTIWGFYTGYTSFKEEIGELIYIGTVMLNAGSMVVHYFEEIK